MRKLYDYDDIINDDEEYVNFCFSREEKWIFTRLLHKTNGVDVAYE